MRRYPFGVIVLLLSSLLVSAQSPSPDPALGSWLGEGGTLQDRVPIGLRFLANPEGRTEVRL